jgi:nucleoside-diphosphate-sugar epimerase
MWKNRRVLVTGGVSFISSHLVDSLLEKGILVASLGAGLTKAGKVLVWEPKVSYAEGFKRTVDWYFANKNEKKVKADLDRLPMER